MKELFSKNVDFDDEVFRNIISLKKSEDLFNDINDQEAEVSVIANLVEGLNKAEYSHQTIIRDFYNSTAITYPFETQPFMASRYSDGKFGVWYGSLKQETSIYETAYHMIKRESGIEGVNEKIKQERAIYKVHCKAILIDLSQQHHTFPQLISEQYNFTQDIGRKLNYEGHPGILAPSARYANGINPVAFTPKILSNPKIHGHLTYIYNPVQGEVNIERSPGKSIFKISKKDFVTWQDMEFV